MPSATQPLRFHLADNTVEITGLDGLGDEMGDSPGTLLQLLFWSQGCLPPDADREMRERLVDDPELRDQWRRLRELGVAEVANGDVADDREPPTNATAYVRGELSPTEAREFEARCWESPTRLVEVAVAIRRNRSNVSDRPKKPAPRTPARPPVESQARTDSSPSFDMSVAPSSLTLDRRRKASSNRALRLIAAGTGGIIFGMVCFLLLTLAIEGDLNTGRRVAKSDRGDDASQPGASGDVNPEEDASDDTNDPDEVEDPPDDPVADSSPSNDDAVVDVNDVVEPSEPEAVPADGDPESAVQEARDIRWDEISGLLAVFDSGTDKWSGGRTRTNIDSPLRMATLPDSWARGQMSEASLVLSSDTDVSVRIPMQRAIDLELQRGAVGLRQLPAETIVDIRFGEASLRVVVAEPGSNLIVRRASEEATVQVVAGAIDVQRKHVSRGRQATWSDGQLTVAAMERRRLEWFTKAPKKNPIPEDVQHELLASRDLPSTLRRVASQQTGPVQTALMSWSMTVSPRTEVRRLLLAKRPKLRERGLNWLSAGDPHDPRVLAAWRSVAAALKDAEALRPIVRSLSLLRQAKPLDVRAVAGLLRGLRHSHVTVRHSADFALRMATSRQVGFVAQAPAAERKQAIDRWTRLLRRLHNGATARDR